MHQGTRFMRAISALADRRVAASVLASEAASAPVRITRTGAVRGFCAYDWEFSIETIYIRHLATIGDDIYQGEETMHGGARRDEGQAGHDGAGRERRGSAGQARHGGA